MPTVSIISAIYNNAPFLDECIYSVLNQSHQDWQWVIVDNGSTDNTKALLAKLSDPRIVVHSLSKNVGVSAGRNEGLKLASGQYVCLLDGDDVLPKHSLKSRLEVFETKSDVAFVDGTVIAFKDSTDKAIDVYTPSFKGPPLERLLSLDGSVFRGNTWMVKREVLASTKFEEAITHGEELLFFASLAHKGKYDYTDQPVLFYRRHEASAMANVEAIAEGYKQLAEKIEQLAHVDRSTLRLFKKRAALIAMKSLIRNGNVLAAISKYIEIRFR